MKNKKTEIEWELLKRTAEYYEFPLAVFFAGKNIFKGKTRNKALRRKAELYDKIKTIIEENDEKDK